MDAEMKAQKQLLVSVEEISESFYADNKYGRALLDELDNRPFDRYLPARVDDGTIA